MLQTVFKLARAQVFLGFLEKSVETPNVIVAVFFSFFKWGKKALCFLLGSPMIGE